MYLKTTLTIQTYIYILVHRFCQIEPTLKALSNALAQHSPHSIQSNSPSVVSLFDRNPVIFGFCVNG